MALHARRRRQKELADREAAGEDLWTEEFSPTVRKRIRALASHRLWSQWTPSVPMAIDGQFARELGIKLGVSSGSSPMSMLLQRLSTGTSPGELYPSLIEALIEAHAACVDDLGRLEAFVNDLNDLFAEERIAFRLVEGQMVEFRSMEMHTEVVEPAIRLLHRSAEWEKVEASYRSALAEIGQDPSDAITDAGTALQEALTLLGCNGNALGPLIRDASKKGIIAPHDAKLLDWVSADRSEKGDGHKASGATRDDAWLAVHVVGALILRLASDDEARATT